MSRTVERWLVWGAGGHGKVVADVIRATGGEIAGFIDADAAKSGTVAEPGGARVLIEESEFLSLLRRGDPLPGSATAVVAAMGNNLRRYSALVELGSLLGPALTHPSAVVSGSARLGPGVVVCPAAVINAAAEIGPGTIINTAAVVEHDCHVGSCAHISPGAILAGSARVADRAWVGAGATVLPGVMIGPDSVVGAGAVVLSEVTACLKVAGVPARVIHLRPQTEGEAEVQGADLDRPDPAAAD